MKEHDEKIIQLRNVGYDVIKEEKLSKPKEIKFRFSLSGTKCISGTCIRKTYNNSFRIIINLVKVKFFEDENGSYTDNKTNKKYKKALIGEEISFNNLKKTLAHEIAHLKFWNHTPQHKSYTNHILKKINQRIGG